MAKVDLSIDLKEIRKVQAWAFLLRCAVLFVFLILALAGVVLTHGVARLFFQILEACLLAHGTELSHQALHRTGTGSLKWDTAIGMALSWGSAVSFFHYKWYHLWHHKENGTQADSESFGYVYRLMTHKSRWVRLAGSLRHASMIDHYLATANRCWLAVRGNLATELRREMPAMSESAAKSIQSEYRAMTILYFVAIVISVATKSSVLFATWLVPVLLWAPVHALIELPEHWATAPRPNEDAFQNTRTIRASWFGAYFTNCNAYHVEHHALAAIPLQRLPAVHRSLVSSGTTFRYLEESYPAFYMKFLADLWRGPIAS